MLKKYGVLLLLAVLLQTAVAEQTLSRLPQPVDAADFQLMDLRGNTKTLADYAGKPLIVNFWATWCPPCREEMPSMNRAWEKIRHEGIAMIAVNSGEDLESVSAFLTSFPVSFPVLLDPNSELTGSWPIRGLPTTFVLDNSGKIVYRATGGREWDDEALLNKVRSLR